jgi:hypothetical protein
MNTNVSTLIKLLLFLIGDSILVSLIMNFLLKIPISFQHSLGLVSIFYGLFPLISSEDT